MVLVDLSNAHAHVQLPSFHALGKTIWVHANHIWVQNLFTTNKLVLRRDPHDYIHMTLFFYLLLSLTNGLKLVLEYTVVF